MRDETEGGGEPAADRPRSGCPGCGREGRRVGRITLRALLRPRPLARLRPGGYRFCPVPDCPVVYFGEGEPFGRDDLRVGVFQKQAEGDRTVCYCLGISEGQIRREAEASGTSVSARRIEALVRAGGCACDVRNPRGTCCLGDVAKLLGSGEPRSPGVQRGRGLDLPPRLKVQACTRRSG